jgi:hypothetical protein
LPGKAIIAIVDDDHSVREALTSLVRSLGYVAMPLECAEDLLNSKHRLHTATIELGFTQESIFSSHETLRWREMDSNPRSPCGGWRLGVCDAIT